MLLHMSDQSHLYDALIARDPIYDGRVFVGVTSTGIFCRLTCPARKPKRENCRFFETVSECVEAGFRPCKRCNPLEPAAKSEPVIAELLAAYEADPGRRWSETDISKLGFDPSTVRRAFKRYLGMTFLEYARLSRLRDGFETLAKGGRVIDAQLDSGFSSPSGFRDAFARLLGQSPGAFTGQEILKADWIDTPIGPMIAVADRSALHLLEFIERKALKSELKDLRAKAKGALGIGRFDPIDQIEAELNAYFKGHSADFKVPIAYHGSDFAKTVWDELRRIPVGKTLRYCDLANSIGRPSAIRAVARANGANRLALVVPCHRVIGADGSLTGYGGGLWRKRWLIDLERRLAEKDTK